MFMVATALAGCATQRTYTGSIRPADQVAVLVTHPSQGLRVETIDERMVSSLAERYELLPGHHTLGIRAANLTADSSRKSSNAGPTSLGFEAEAGHSYRLRGLRDTPTASPTPLIDDAGPIPAGRSPAATRELIGACHAGQMPSCVELGSLHEVGSLELSWDEQLSAKLYAQACDAGLPSGCLRLALLVESGHGVARDEARAADLFQRACAAREARACTGLAHLLRQGRGRSKDERRARELYEQACDSREPGACHTLGMLARDAPDGSADYGRAATLFERACDGGEPRGCAELGLLHENGLGVAQDDRRAALLYEKGCVGGSALACANLGVLYQLGLGVARSKVRARELFKKGCARQLASACASLDRLGPELPPAGQTADLKEVCTEYTPTGSHIQSRNCQVIWTGDFPEGNEKSDPDTLRSWGLGTGVAGSMMILGGAIAGDVAFSAYKKEQEAAAGGDADAYLLNRNIAVTAVIAAPVLYGAGAVALGVAAFLYLKAPGDIKAGVGTGDGRVSIIVGRDF